MRFGRFLFALAIVIGVQLVGDYVFQAVGQEANWVASSVLAILAGVILWKLRAGVGEDVTKVASGLFLLDIILLALVVSYFASAAARAGSTDPNAILEEAQKDFENFDQWMLDFFRFFIPEQVEQYEGSQQSPTRGLDPPRDDMYNCNRASASACAAL